MHKNVPCHRPTSPPSNFISSASCALPLSWVHTSEAHSVVHRRRFALVSSCCCHRNRIACCCFQDIHPPGQKISSLAHFVGLLDPRVAKIRVGKSFRTARRVQDVLLNRRENDVRVRFGDQVDIFHQQNFMIEFRTNHEPHISPSKQSGIVIVVDV